MTIVQQPANFTVNVNITAILPECCFDVLYCVKSCKKIDDHTATLHFGNNNHASLYNLDGEKHYVQCYDKCHSTPYLSFSDKNNDKIPEYLIYQTHNTPSIDLQDFSHNYNTLWHVNECCENNKIDLHIKKIYNDLYIIAQFMIPEGYKALNSADYKIELLDETYDLSEIKIGDSTFDNKTIKISNYLLNHNKISLKVTSYNNLYIALKNTNVIGTIYKFDTLTCVEISKI
jgi:sRNA-binding regulator protein Hfq